jgi:integrase/recombinase XerC
VVAPLTNAVDRFLDYLRVERRYSASTLDNYARALARLSAHAQRLGLQQWSDLRSAQLQSLLAELHRG